VVLELRINGISGTWRIVYKVAVDAIVVLEVYSKTTQTTPREIEEVCWRRLRQYEAISRGDSDINTAKWKTLEKAGWKVGTPQEFLNLSLEEAAYVEVKLNPARVLSKRRKPLRLTQVAVAKKIKSIQSWVAKMEADDPSVSIDLLVRSLIALGETPTNLQKVL
jgi:hypothetical protein